MLSTKYMLIAVKYIVDESIDDGRLANCLVSQEDYFVLQKRRDCAFGQIEIADVRSHL